MSLLAEPIRLALRVGRALDELNVSWLVGGSVASSVQGLPRATQDIDLVAALLKRHAGPLTAALEAEFYIDRDAIIEAINRRGAFNLIHFDTMTKVDIFIPREDPLSAAQIPRRQWVHFNLPDLQSLPVLSPEDVILQKLRWYEMTERGSERQWRDILGVLKVRRGSLDLGYLLGQAEAAGLGQLLADAVADRIPGASDG